MISAEMVRQIMDDIDLTDAQIQPYITSATNLTDRAIPGTGLGSDLREEVERWIAAHMIAISRERQALSEEAGGAKVVYTGIYELGLNSTSYGQMAMTMDITGRLSALTGKRAWMKAVKS